MLSDDSSAVNTYYLSVWERPLYLLYSLPVLLRLVICGHEYSPVDDKEVRMSGRKSLAIIIDSIGHGQRE